MDPHCSYRTTVSFSVTAAAARFLLLYGPQVINIKNPEAIPILHDPYTTLGKHKVALSILSFCSPIVAILLSLLTVSLVL